MIRNILMFMVLTCLGVGYGSNLLSMLSTAAREGEHKIMSGGADAKPAALTQAPAPERQAAAFRETTLSADSRGQYAADVLLNGSDVHMLVDTGATVVSISSATAARIGANPGPGRKWVVQTANGKAQASPTVLRELSVGGLYMQNVEALILPPEAGDVNLLGASFLRRLSSVEQHNGLLVLRQ